MGHQQRRPDPTPLQVALRAAQIKRRWTAKEREQRRLAARHIRLDLVRQPEVIPVVRARDLELAPDA